MQWGEADNENTAKQKIDQAKCEEIGTSFLKIKGRAGLSLENPLLYILVV